MNGTSTTPNTPERSRLDPEPVPRRDFLGLSAVGAAGAAMLFALVGLLRLPKAAVLPTPSKRFRVTLPESLGVAEPYVPPGRSVALVRDREGLYAISTVCTHLGCIVKCAADGFHCPCHGSQFAPDGTVVKGPAPKPLPWLSITKSGGDVYVVDLGRTVAQGTRLA
jgi:cytochrome b6-f complex iron-sulfur subunit